MKYGLTLMAVSLALGCTAAPADARRGKLPPYPYALRCAALTEAVSRQEDSLGKPDSGAFGRAIFWAMAASEAARKAKLSGKTFTEDQAREGPIALAQLNANDQAAKAQLAACLSQVPPAR